MTQTQLIGIAAGIISFSAIVPYVRSILRGETKPNRASWGIWVVLSILLLVTYYFSGGRDAIWISVSYAIFPLIVFSLSIKYGVGGLARLDVICLIGALIGLLAWFLTKDAVVGLFSSMVVDIFGFIPTLKKAYVDPESENTLGWGIATFSNLLNLFAISAWTLQVAVYPVYLALMQTLVFLPLAAHDIQTRRRTTQRSRHTVQSK